MEEELKKDMTPKLIGETYMKYPTERSRDKIRYGLYECQYCGQEFECATKSIKSGHTKSCGCLAQKGNNTSHGLCNHPLYYTWSHMKHRCNNSNNIKYKNYGGRGIKVCDRWLDINNFIEDMYPSYQEDLSLDRIDVNGNYEPTNCRWATNEMQSRNTRDICKNNTSGFRGVSWKKRRNNWGVQIMVDNKLIYLGTFKTALEGAKAYEIYVRLNSLDHNFTPALTEEEIEALDETL